MYTIIGNGRLAKHIIHYFNYCRVSYQQWHRSSPLALQDCLQNSTHVLFLITDQGIEKFIDAHSNLLNQKMLIHCSGALMTEKAYSAHPLMTFNHALYPVENYAEIPFIIEKEGPDFSDLLPGLNNPHYAISRKDKMHYHALVVLANNFSTLLWQKCFKEMQNLFNIPSSAILPILQQTFINLKQDHLSALTGPLVRNDQETLQKNLKALMNDPFQEIYQSFITAYQRENYENH